MSSENIYKEKTEKFITRAMSIHGDKYDYSKSNFVNSQTKVEIICPTHGSWLTLPQNHTKGSGCPKCANENRNRSKIRSTAEVVAIMKETHGDRFDYSLFEFKNAKTKGKIICRKHGVFEQSFDAHRRGVACPECYKEKSKESPNRKISYDEALTRMQEKHGERYTYLKETYQGYKSKMTMECPVHGSFHQSPNVHTNSSQGCPRCADEVCRSSRILTSEEVLSEFRKIHGSKYEYPNFDYKGNIATIEIVCPSHGSFEQTPKDHKRGHGCPACGVELSREIRQSKVFDLKIRFAKIHGDYYDYSLVEQPKNTQDKIKIVCPKHGVFHQTPSNHLSGKGCRKCAYERVAEQSRVEYGSDCESLKFYLVRLYDEQEEFLKIGITKNTPEYRLRQCGYNIDVISVIEDDPKKIIELEESMIEELRDNRYRVHQLKEAASNGWTECFRMEELSTILDALGKLA